VGAGGWLQSQLSLGENIMQDRKGGFEPDVRNRFINPFVRAYIRRIDELLV
jgi:hypothetical protein